LTDAPVYDYHVVAANGYGRNSDHREEDTVDVGSSPLGMLCRHQRMVYSKDLNEL
jgi:hypothetical protein